MGFVDESTGQQRLRRIPYRAKIIMRPAESGEQVEGEVWDLSMGGMFIKALVPLTAGSVFYVEIPMQPLSFRVPVRVLRTRHSEAGEDRPYGMAVEFVDLTTYQKRTLLRQVEEHVRTGGGLLVGTAEAAREEMLAAGAQKALKADVPSHTRLIVGLSIVVVVMLVVLLIFF